MNPLDRLRTLRDALPAHGSVVLTREALSELLGEVPAEDVNHGTHTGDLTVEEIAAELKRSPNRVRDWIRSDELKAYRFGKEYRCTRASLDAFIEVKRAGKREIAGTGGKPADIGRWRNVRGKAAGARTQK